MNEIIKDYREIYEVSSKKYNIFKSGSKFDFIDYYFSNKLNNYQCEPIQQYELKFIEKATRRPHCDCKIGTYEKVYYYDMKKAYAKIIGSSSFKVPIRKGKLINFTQEEADKIIKNGYNFIYGIYKAHIEGDDKRFVFNPKNYYTSTDLNCAVKLGLKIQIREKEGNALIYKCAETCIESKNIFWQFIGDFYEYSKKCPNNKVIKFFLS